MTNQQQEGSPKGLLKTMQIIHGALILGILVVFYLFYLQVDSWEMDLNNLDYIFPYLIPLASVAGIILGNVLFTTTIKTGRNQDRLMSKLSAYMTGSLQKYALLEAPMFLALFAGRETGNGAYLLFVVILLIFMVYQFPSASRAEQVLELKGAEKDQFRRSING